MSWIRLSLIFLLLCLYHSVGMCGMVCGHAPEEIERLGERMYREGILPDGSPMKAVIQGDIEVDGTMFSCASCHLRSGLGTLEGTVVSRPVNGAKLYRPYSLASPEVKPKWRRVPGWMQWTTERPAYDDDSLAMAIWTGIDPAGHRLNPVMPRYNLDDCDMEILVQYLKHLNVDYSPGVNATTMILATVFSDGVDKEKLDTMLKVLEAIVHDRNTQGRHQEARAKGGPFFRQRRYSAYRRFRLVKWHLTGPREKWGQQLERYYAQDKPFALVAGMVKGTWEPVHRFCEKNRLPAILPITDLPVISKRDWYTLYFSKGIYQEAAAAARWEIRKHGQSEHGKGREIQVVFKGSSAIAAAKGVDDTYQLLLHREVPVLYLERGDQSFWRHVFESYDVVFVWLEQQDMETLAKVMETWHGPLPRLYLSYTLSGDAAFDSPFTREGVRIAYPYRLPAKERIYIAPVVNWLKVRKISTAYPRVAAKVYYIGWLLTGVLRMMSTDFYRDYLLDVIDMMNDEVYALAVYPRMSFGPGQRYGVKGCYVCRPAPGGKLADCSPWVIH